MDMLGIFLVADKRLYTLPCWSVGWSVGRSVGPSVAFLNSERFSHYCFRPTVRDWIAMYPALFGLFSSYTGFLASSSSRGLATP